MKKSIILVLGDDKAINQGAEIIENELQQKGYEVVVSAFSDETALVGLSSKDVEYITIIGHGNTLKYGEFDAYDFVQAFDKLLLKAKIDKHDIRGVRCIGCGLGFIQVNGMSLAQQISNEFYLEGYNRLLILALSNYDYPKDLAKMVLSTSHHKIRIRAVLNENKDILHETEQGLLTNNQLLKQHQKELRLNEINYDKVDDKKNEILLLVDQIQQKIEQSLDQERIITLQFKLSEHQKKHDQLTNKLLGLLEKQDELKREIDNSETKRKLIRSELGQLRVTLYETQTVINDLDYNIKNQFLPRRDENLIETIKNRIEVVEQKITESKDYLKRAHILLEKAKNQPEQCEEKLNKIQIFIEKHESIINALISQKKQLIAQIHGIENKDEAFFMSQEQRDMIYKLLIAKNDFHRELYGSTYINTPYESKRDKEYKIVDLDKLIEALWEPVKHWENIITNNQNEVGIKILLMQHNYIASQKISTSNIEEIPSKRY